jgi:hypothetical protein
MFSTVELLFLLFLLLVFPWCFFLVSYFAWPCSVLYSPYGGILKNRKIPFYCTISHKYECNKKGTQRFSGQFHFILDTLRYILPNSI